MYVCRIENSEFELDEDDGFVEGQWVRIQHVERRGDWPGVYMQQSSLSVIRYGVDMESYKIYLSIDEYHLRLPDLPVQYARSYGVRDAARRRFLGTQTNLKKSGHI